ncbi:MAG: sugar phosphate isomerase/epimerase, partial [Flavobacteriaceae bacterium]
MSAYLKILIFLLILTEPVWSQNELLFFQTNWGFSGSWEAFFSKTKASGYDGVEIWFPKEKEQLQEVAQGLQKHELKVIYLCGTNRDLPFEESLSAYQNDLIRAIDQKPYAINSHTGSDFFSFEQNKKFILLANKLSKKYKIPIYHETHRGRFSYSLPETKR